MNNLQILARVGCAIALSLWTYPLQKASAQSLSPNDELNAGSQAPICSHSLPEDCYSQTLKNLVEFTAQNSAAPLFNHDASQDREPILTEDKISSSRLKSEDAQFSQITKNFDISSKSWSNASLREQLKAISPTRETLAQASSEGVDTAGSRPRLRRERTSPDDPVFRPRGDILLEQGGRFGPGISVLTPTAYGKSWRTLSVGAGFQERTRFSDTADGAVGIGFGLGDAEKLVGLDIGITFTDLSDIFNRGIVSFKLHRRLPENFAVAVGVNDALTWGNSDLDGPSPYGVVSKVIKLRQSTTDPLSRLSLSFGVGTGRYRTIFDTESDNEAPNVFGSAALRVVDPINIITEWTGQDLTVGMSVRPFPKIPLVITPAFTDITGSAGDGWRFILGAGYIFQF